jgi:hypothetical protein
MSQDQDENVVTESNSKDGLVEKEIIQDNNIVALKHSTLGGWRDNTKGLNNKKNRDGKLILGQPSTPKNIVQHSSFIAKGQQIVLNPQENTKPNEYIIGGKIQNMVDNLTSEIVNKKSEKGYGLEDTSIEILDEVDDENLTSRAIRACIVAEATIAALKEECKLLPPKLHDGKFKSGHAKHDCKCPGKGATCNATMSLQLQLAACENLSLAATAAFRELVAARLGVAMPTPLASNSSSPKKQRKKSKKSKKENPSGQMIKTHIGLQVGSSPRESMLLPKKKSFSKCNSFAIEQPPMGPFNCSHPIPQYVPQMKLHHKNPSACHHDPIAVIPQPDCFPGMFNLQFSTIM